MNEHYMKENMYVLIMVKEICYIPGFAHRFDLAITFWIKIPASKMNEEIAFDKMKYFFRQKIFRGEIIWRSPIHRKIDKFCIINARVYTKQAWIESFLEWAELYAECVRNE